MPSVKQLRISKDGWMALSDHFYNKLLGYMNWKVTRDRGRLKYSYFRLPWTSAGINNFYAILKHDSAKERLILHFKTDPGGPTTTYYDEEALVMFCKSTSTDILEILATGWFNYETSYQS